MRTRDTRHGGRKSRSGRSRLARRTWRRLRGQVRRPERVTRRGMVALALVLAALGGLVGGLVQLRVDTGITSFLPAGDRDLTAMQDKAREFGGDPVVVLLESTEPQHLIAGPGQIQQLIQLEGALAKTPDVSAVYGPGTAVNQVAKASQGLLAQITGRRDALLNAVGQAQADGPPAVAQAQANLSEFERRYGALIVRALPAGLPTATNSRFVRSVVFGDDGRARPQWSAVVPSPTTAAVLVRPRADLDQAGTARLVAAVQDAVGNAGLETSKVTVSGVPTVTASLTDRARTEFPLLGALALVAVAALYLLVPWSRGRRLDRLRPLLVALAGTAITLAAFGWTGRPVSLGVIAFLPVLLGIGSDFPLYLAQPAHRRRVLAAAGAGAAAFAALALSPLPFVRELGIALAVGIVATVGTALLVRRWLPDLEPRETATRSLRPSTPAWGVRLPALVAAIAIAVAGWGALGALRIEAQPERLAAGLPALDNAEYAERVMGASGEVSVMLTGGDGLSPEALAWSRSAETVIEQRFADRVRPITTIPGLLAFLGPNPTADQIQAAAELMPSYLSSAVITPDHRTSLLVLGIGLQDLDDQSALIDGMRAALPPTPPGYRAEIVGLPVAAVSAYEAVTDGRMLINLAAIGLAAAVLLLGLRRRADAGRAVLTAVLSGGWMFALTWLFTDTLSPLTVAVGALTTATGCEFAVMLADARRHGRPWQVRSVGLAASAAAVGYLVLAASDLAMLREFGLLLAGSVVVSCVAAGVVVGVLLPPAPVEPVEPVGPADRDDISESDDSDSADAPVADREVVTV